MAKRKSRTRDSLRYHRRSLLIGTAALASVSGCLGTGGTTNAAAPAAVSLSNSATCDVCGMVITQHPGPTAEVFYTHNSPDGHAPPAHFDTTWEAYQYDFEHQNRGWKRTAFYVTDYSSVTDHIPEDGGDESITRSVRKNAFASVDDVTYVVGSEVLGAMGTDLIAFTSKDDATSFQSKHGGKLVTHDEVTPDAIASLRG